MRLAAEMQVKASQEQLEGQIKPAVIARLPNNGHRIELVNIGNGPALHFEFKSVLRGAIDEKVVMGLDYDKIAFLEPAQAALTRIRTCEPDIPGTYNLHCNSRSLRCEYRSLSGRVYFSVFIFDEAGNFVENTLFGECGV